MVIWTYEKECDLVTQNEIAKGAKLQYTLRLIYQWTHQWIGPARWLQGVSLADGITRQWCNQHQYL